MDDALLVLAEKLGRQLQVNGHILALAESCTGGLASAYITAIPGSSAWFDAGYITYSNAAKKQQLGVSEATLATHGAVSEATAREMASGALKSGQASLAAAITGIAGPDGGTPEKPVGMVCFAIATPQHISTFVSYFCGDRAKIRHQSVAFIFTKLSQL